MAATIDDLLQLFDTKPKASRQTRLETLLGVATEELEEEAFGASPVFARNPATGTRTWYEDTDGSGMLHAHYGISEIESVSFSFDQGATFATLEATEYRLQTTDHDSSDPSAAEPWFHLRMLPYGSYHAFPRGTGLVRLVGATGWRAMPKAAREGIVERARQLAFADPSYQGEVPSADEFGRPTVSTRWPDVTWKFIQREKQRHMACSI